MQDVVELWNRVAAFYADWHLCSSLSLSLSLGSSRLMLSSSSTFRTRSGGIALRWYLVLTLLELKPFISFVAMRECFEIRKSIGRGLAWSGLSPPSSASPLFIRLWLTNHIHHFSSLFSAKYISKASWLIHARLSSSRGRF